jgi:hypothetical protein
MASSTLASMQALPGLALSPRTSLGAGPSLCYCLGRRATTSGRCARNGLPTDARSCRGAAQVSSASTSPARVLATGAAEHVPASDETRARDKVRDARRSAYAMPIQTDPTVRTLLPTARLAPRGYVTGRTRRDRSMTRVASWPPPRSSQISQPLASTTVDSYGRISARTCFPDFAWLVGHLRCASLCPPSRARAHADERLQPPPFRL